METPSLGITPPKRKSRASLKFLASTCVFSAWITLILAVGGAISIFLAPASLGALGGAAGTSAPAISSTPPPPESGSGGDDLGMGRTGMSGLSNLGGTMGLAMLAPLVGPLCFAGGVFTLVSGIVTFIIFLGLGQACYVLIDLEEQSIQQGEALGIIIARLGQGR